MPSNMYDTHPTRIIAMTSLVLCEILLARGHDQDVHDKLPGLFQVLDTLRRDGTLSELRDMHPNPDDVPAIVALLEDIMVRATLANKHR